MNFPQLCAILYLQRINIRESGNEILDWLNVYGIVIMFVIMIPNIVFGATHKEGFENKYNNRIFEVLEQIGRFGSFAFMIVYVPGATLGYWLDNAELFYIIINGVLCAAYCVSWVVFWNKNSLPKALVLSVLPSLMFIFSGLILLNIPLIITSVIFSFSHVLISYKNAVIK